MEEIPIVTPVIVMLVRVAVVVFDDLLKKLTNLYFG